MDENSMLLLRYSSYKKYDFIREHNSIIKNKGSVWMLKVGKCIPENKLQKMYEYGGVMYLRSPKIEGEKFYKAIIKAYYSSEPKRNMILLKYYNEMLNDEDLKKDVFYIMARYRCQMDATDLSMLMKMVMKKLFTVGGLTTTIQHLQARKRY